MNKPLLLSDGFTTAYTSIVTTATRYLIVHSGRSAPTALLTSAEIEVQQIWRDDGIFTFWYGNVLANSWSGASTLQFRKNTANGNLSISIGAASSGEFFDTTNTDTVTATDLISGTLTCSGAGGMTFRGSAVVYNSNTARPVGRLGTSGTGNANSATTVFHRLIGQMNVTTADTTLTVLMGTLGFISNMQVYISANTATVTNTYGTRYSGANGAQSVSILTTATGFFEDTTVTETVTAANKICWREAMVAGTGTCTCTFASLLWRGKIGGAPLAASANGSISIAATATQYSMMSGSLTITTTESNAQQTTKLTRASLRVLYLRLATNTITASSTATVRQNAADTALTVSITASTTGDFQDLTVGIPLTFNDKLNYKFVGGATGTSIAIVHIMTDVVYPSPGRSPSGSGAVASPMFY